MNKVVALAAAAAGVALAAWRRRSVRRAHADLYFDDGSMVSLAAGDDDADRLLAIASELITAARGAPGAAGSAGP